MCADLLGRRGHVIALEKDSRRRATLIRRLIHEGQLRGPYLSPCCQQQHAATRNNGSSSGNSSCSSSSSNSNSSSKSSRAHFLRLSEMAAKRPLYFARSDEAPHSAAGGAAAAAGAATAAAPAVAAATTAAGRSYPRLASSVPHLLVEVRGTDFTSVEGKQSPFCFVEKILLDPSCSGSGLPTHQSMPATPTPPREIPTPVAATPTTATATAEEAAEISTATAAAAATDAAAAAARDCPGDEPPVAAAAAERSTATFEELPDLLQCSWEGWSSRSDGTSPGGPQRRGPLPTVIPPAGEERRVSRLATLQQKLLLHALSSFPSAFVVCYSTCSVYTLENEGVLSNVGLQQQQQQQQEQQQQQQQQKGSLALWSVCRPAALHPGWFPPPSAVAELQQQIESSSNSNSSTNGSSHSSSSDSKRLSEAMKSFGCLCVRASPQTHRCRGFFLATIQRDKPPPPTAALGAATAAASAATSTAAATAGGRGRGKRKQREKAKNEVSIPATGGDKSNKKRKIRGCSKAGIRV